MSSQETQRTTQRVRVLVSYSGADRAAAGAADEDLGGALELDVLDGVVVGVGRLGSRTVFAGSCEPGCGSLCTGLTG